MHVMCTDQGFTLGPNLLALTGRLIGSNQYIQRLVELFSVKADLLRLVTHWL